uniref:Cytochrome f n=1 Tax=Medicago truncatula TaxID=3880 RepID=A2Q1S3_MEDTR|nr:Cytochrome f [Medicago truncatula]
MNFQISNLRFICKHGNLSFKSYHPTKKYILVVGPVPEKKFNEIIFLILSPDPATKRDVHFLKYLIYVRRWE